MKIREGSKYMRKFKARTQIMQKYLWWEPPDHSVQFDYFRNTSLHGLKYIGQSNRHLIERIFWLVAFVSGVIVAFVLIRDVFRKYRTNPVIVSFTPFAIQIEDIPFPAITICNMNKVLKSKATGYINDAANESLVRDDRKRAIKNIYYMDHVCSSTKSFSKRFNYSLAKGAVTLPYVDLNNVGTDEFGERADVKEFLNKASQPCSDMLELCIWNEVIVSCKDIFKPIETDFGKCCTFNMVPPTLLDTLKNDTRDDPEDVQEWAKWHVGKDGIFLWKGYNFKFPRRQMRAGKSFGLSFLLDPNMDEYFCTTSDSTGFRMVAHLPIEFPQVVDFGIAIKPRSEVFIGIRPEIVMSEESIAGFPLEKRECYFPGEYQLEYYNYYTITNCINECIANETYKQCDCVSYYMPRDDTRDLCGPNDFQCTRTVKSQFSNEGGKTTSCSHCLPACTEIHYIMELTETPLQNEEDLWVDELQNKAPWIGHNVSIVHVYFCQDSAYARLRKELYGITDLIANTGGLLGLCLGFSGLSFVEVIYFLTLRAWCSKRNHKPMLARAVGKIQQAIVYWGSSKQANHQHILPTTGSSLGLNSNFYGWEISPKSSGTSARVPDNRYMNWPETISRSEQQQQQQRPQRSNHNELVNSVQQMNNFANMELSQYSKNNFWSVE